MTALTATVAPQHSVGTGIRWPAIALRSAHKALLHSNEASGEQATDDCFRGGCRWFGLPVGGSRAQMSLVLRTPRRAARPCGTCSRTDARSRLCIRRLDGGDIAITDAGDLSVNIKVFIENEDGLAKRHSSSCRDNRR